MKYKHTHTTTSNIQKITEEFQELRAENQSCSTEELNQTLNQIVENVDRNYLSMEKLQPLHDKMIDRIETKHGYPEKLFMARNSLLTDLVELPHLNSIHNFLLVSLITFFTHALVTDITERGTVDLKLGEGLTNIHMAVFTWICMFTSTVAVYCAFFFWASVRVNVIEKTRAAILDVWDALWLLFFVVYIFSFFYFTIKSVIDNSLDIFVSQLIVMEMNRMFMKMYAFVRSNTPRVLKYKRDDEDEPLCPDFSKFLYFLFAPTLVYRDSYPRTSHIRWNFVILYLAEIYGAMFCMHYVQAYILVPSFQDYDLQNITPQDFILLLLKNAFSNLLCWLSMVFGMFHALQNFFAELLRFSDRLFYKDWWNSESAEKLYTTFSVAVNDWTSLYLYRDLYKVVRKNAIVAKTLEVLLVLILHEFAYSFPYRFYCSFLAVYGTMGFIVLTCFSKNYFIRNTIFLYGLLTGVSLLRTGLTLEYYVRLSCPMENPTLLSYFVPRTFTCNCTKEN